MGQISDQFEVAFRDFVLDGVPSSGRREVNKSEVRPIGGMIESALGTVGLAGLVSVAYSTRSALEEDLNHVAATIGLVYADGSDANNDLYVKLGASGSGSWALTNALHLIVAARATPLILDLKGAGIVGSGTLAEREAYTYRYGGTPTVSEGAIWLRKEPDEDMRIGVWVSEGNKGPSGIDATYTGWHEYKNQAEMDNMSLDKTGTLPATNVQYLPDALSGIDSLAAIQIAGFRAQAQSTDAHPLVKLDWSIKGQQPNSQTLSWGASSIALRGSARSFVPKDWAALKPLFVVGNSLSDSTDTTDRWSQVLAAARGVSLYSVARYSSDARQVYRCGAAPLYLTIASNTLPAGGTSASVTAINGVAPSNDASVNPASFLNTGDAGLTTGISMTGTIVAGSQTRHVTVSIPNAASTSYSIVGDAGQGSLATGGPVLFLPDIARQMASSDLTIWPGNNNFFSGVPNSYGDYTNPQMWVDLAKIVAAAEGNRVLILPVIPDSSWSTSGTGNPYTAMQAANARTEALYPAYVARDAAGRTLLQRLQASGDGSSNDNADIAAGFVPRSLHRSGDTLHLNSAGDAVVAAFVQEAMARQALPAAITQNTVFALQATGTNPRTDAMITDTATAPIVPDPSIALTPGGNLANGEWVKLPAIYKLVMSGTGNVTLDTKTRAGAITTGAGSYSPSGSELIAYPYFGASAAYVRATLTGTATAEIV